MIELTKEDIEKFKVEVLDKYKEKIRNRNSYKNFDDTLKWLSERKRNPEEILWKIHNIIDGMGGYRYQRTSDFAKESLLLLLIDIGVK